MVNGNKSHLMCGCWVQMIVIFNLISSFLLVVLFKSIKVYERSKHREQQNGIVLTILRPHRKLIMCISMKVTGRQTDTTTSERGHTITSERGRLRGIAEDFIELYDRKGKKFTSYALLSLKMMEYNSHHTPPRSNCFSKNFETRGICIVVVLPSSS